MDYAVQWRISTETDRQLILIATALRFTPLRPWNPMATQLYLVLIETSGNQAFIFSTNKLKENVGASEATYRVCGEWVLEAIHSVTDKACNLWSPNVAQLRTNLVHQPKIVENPDQLVEIIVLASGKTLLLTRTEAIAKAIITKVTLKALKEAPGVDVCGLYVQFDWETKNLGDVNHQVHEQYAAVQASRPGVIHRFPRLPVVAECSTSGLPAAKLCKAPGNGDRYIPKSQVSLSKEGFRDRAYDRINRLVSKNLIRDLDKLESSDWLAIVHVDGNGLGEIFLKFHEHLARIESGHDVAKFNEHYVSYLRKFSIALDECTEAAFIETLNAVFPASGEADSAEIPLVPLILGGDDLTVICEGKDALRFTHTFLKHFEEKTSQNGAIKGMAKQALGQAKLSACAGIAIVKPHFPFSEAYHLAEQLIKSAKTVKQKIAWPNEPGKLYPCSAIDFHIVYDSSNLDLTRIRGHLYVDRDATGKAQTFLCGKPYVVTAAEHLEQAHPDGQAWAQRHRWESFEEAVKAINKKGLPSSQAHTLRQTLFSGREATMAYLELIQMRYQNDGELEGLLPLFYPDGPMMLTRFLDAIDAQGFLVPNDITTSSK
jgi:hypothetical protein